MGSHKGLKRELPITKITIAKPFAVGRYEVTFNEWDACHDAGGCKKRPFDRHWGRGNRPVIDILHSEAVEYTVWLSKLTGKHYHLPSESEWEYATRAGTTTEYWWGDDIGQGLANCRKCGTVWSGIKSAPVGSFEQNPWKLYDVAGNVLEYAADCYVDSLAGIPTDGSPRVVPGCKNYTVRGGAWYYLPKVSRSASRARNDARVFSYFIGFRVVRDIADGEQVPPPVASAFPETAAERVPALKRQLPLQTEEPRRRIR
jgi:formylglycine-generating enzyme required for sulfatase activity